MSFTSDQYISSLLSRARDGFLRLEEVVDREEALTACEQAQEDLEKLLSATVELETPQVLVVDDDEAVRNVIARHLERRGYTCERAESAQAAWDMMENNLPHVVVSDVVMPQTNGIDFLHEVMYRFPDMVMVLVSAAPDVKMSIDALRAGAADFILKPIDFNALHESIERGLSRRKARLNQLRYQLNLELIASERSRRLLEYAEALQHKTQQLSLAYRDVVVRLGRAAQWRDDETGSHIQRIGIFSAEIARAIGMTKEEVDLLAEASPLHDIGKIGVPDSILLKPGRLTPAEFEIMKQHTMIGAAILSGSEAPLLRSSEEIALTHHEWWNGGGYPRGLSGTEVPIYGYIVALADVYDALIHQRTYKKALPLDQAITTMKARRGTQFHPDAFDCFIAVVDKFPDLERRLAEATTPVDTKYGVRMGLFHQMLQEATAAGSVVEEEAPA